MPSISHNPKWTPGFSRILVLLGLSIFINYIDRSNLSIAAPLLKDELGLSASQLGILLSAFFWTYSCCQLLSGWLVDRFDVKWVFGAGFFLWSGATAVTGLVRSLTLLLVVRVVLGMGESVAYPSYSKIMTLHCPEGRRGVANSQPGPSREGAPRGCNAPLLDEPTNDLDVDTTACARGRAPRVPGLRGGDQPRPLNP